MIIPTIINFFLYFCLVWFSNISLNLLYVLKKYYPIIDKKDKKIDGGLFYKNNRLIGESATVFGLFISFTLTFILYLFNFSLPYLMIPILVYLGHTLGSFIKRRMNKKDGDFVQFVDHLDYVILTGSILYFLNFINLYFLIFSLILTYILHPVACFIAYKFELKKHPY